jgi:Putative restriction endonuclease
LSIDYLVIAGRLPVAVALFSVDEYRICSAATPKLMGRQNPKTQSPKVFENKGCQKSCGLPLTLWPEYGNFGTKVTIKKPLIPLQGDGNEQRDKSIKLKLYSQYCVQEYWIANWQLKTLEIYRRTDAQLQFVATLVAGDTLVSPLLPGFSVLLDRFFIQYDDN